MRVLVPIKRVVDYNVKINVKQDGTGVDLGNVKMSMNPFDEIALEAAIRMKEDGLAEQVIAVSVGSKDCEDVLRTALALGADRARLVTVADGTDAGIEPLAVAKILSKIVRNEQIDLVICGKQAIDDDMNATGQMLSGLLRWSQATFAYEIEVADDQLVVTREIDAGLQTIKVPLPAVVTADLRLNEPRYATLPNIMRAKKKPIEANPVEEFDVDLAPHLEILRTDEPPLRSAGTLVGSVDELVGKLKEAEVV